MLMPLELDPNSVVAGWIPVVVILVLAIACFFLFRSMRKQMRRIDIPEEGVQTRPEPDRDQTRS
ncbi:hypothetical protein HJ590_01910 [Naumannella sp. ID2617S]|uniref:Uncharacterized protein n=1 Tax=Enemella dayhoffiae TaxID=2016507 RepID=A0A255GU69_9ACTN|nr:hypothetical protein [Enemella dayhoffiae]NNG18344.1 hypothetical protein [Naumannella sp. ID2617S]OYO18133.1 hypothetical protein CGZ93_16425 [Enemella dayhoffiae]